MINYARLILSDLDEYGWGLESPELPSLIGGAAARDEWSEDDLWELATEAGLSPRGSVDHFVQRVLHIDGGVFLIRAREDYLIEDRGVIAAQLEHMLKTESDLRARAERNELGDALYLMCLPDERVSNALLGCDVDQYTTLVMPRGEELRFMSVWHSAKGPADGEAMVSLSDIGVANDDEVKDLFAAVDRGLGAGETAQARVFA